LISIIHFQEKLELPLSVELVDGVVERINFGEEDRTWSKNIKRKLKLVF
jgi:hypothetical protein